MATRHARNKLKQDQPGPSQPQSCLEIDSEFMTKFIAALHQAQDEERTMSATRDAKKVKQGAIEICRTRTRRRTLEVEPRGLGMNVWSVSRPQQRHVAGPNDVPDPDSSLPKVHRHPGLLPVSLGHTESLAMETAALKLESGQERQASIPTLTITLASTTIPTTKSTTTLASTPASASTTTPASTPAPLSEQELSKEPQDEQTPKSTPAESSNTNERNEPRQTAKQTETTTDPTKGTFTLLLFGPLSTYCHDIQQLTFPAPMSMTALFSEMERKYAGVHAILRTCQVVVGLEYVDFDAERAVESILSTTRGGRGDTDDGGVISGDGGGQAAGDVMILDGDEVGFVPPVSSG